MRNLLWLALLLASPRAVAQQTHCAQCLHGCAARALATNNLIMRETSQSSGLNQGPCVAMKTELKKTVGSEPQQQITEGDFNERYERDFRT
jgi:hypothetical protein